MALMGAIIILSIIGIFIATYKDIIKEDNKKVKIALIAVMIISIMSVGLLSYKEWDAGKKEDEYKRNQQTQLILQDVLKYRIAILDNYTFLVTKSWLLFNYMNWEEARKHNDSNHFMKPWEELVSEETKNDFYKSKQAFEELQKIARDILILSATYKNIVPDSSVRWAEKTLSLRFDELSKMIDGYRSDKEVLDYAKLTGQSIGEMTGKASVTSEKIMQ